MFDLFDYAGRSGTALLRLLPAEVAHDVGMHLLSCGLMNALPAPEFLSHGVAMATDIPGVAALPHPIGLAAGFDKNARAMVAFQRMGFSFMELGTVTPQPQPGNPRPRLFRDSGQRALVNRMGFNSDGCVKVARRIEAAKWTNFHPPLGINLGKNKDTPPDRALRDYVRGLECFTNLVRYFVINISSPNTPGLRALATPEFIKALAKEAAASHLKKTWIKLDPDMGRESLQSLVEAIIDAGFRGVILSNTHRVEYPEAGGQSGHPLLSLSNSVLEWAWQVHRGSLPVVATGGILSGVDIFHKIARGACAVQIYTALVYRGPAVVARLHEELALELKLRGFTALRDAIGSWYKGS